MREFFPFLRDLLLGIEFLSALVSIIYLIRVKRNYWSLFAVYLILIFIQELFWRFTPTFLSLRKQDYYAFLGIPIQYLFLFWLYALKSLKRKKLFITYFLVYCATYIPLEIFVKKIHVVYSINLTIGTILLTTLIVMEFIKQIKNDYILKFKENKMFYINLGIVLFYIGTFPFFAFYYELALHHKNIWDIYYFFSLVTSCIMYLLFIASFIWGKHQSQ